MRYDFWKTTQKSVTLSVFTIDPGPARRRHRGVIFLLSIARSQQGLGDVEGRPWGRSLAGRLPWTRPWRDLPRARTTSGGGEQEKNWASLLLDY
jgi:hypothetical protein